MHNHSTGEEKVPGPAHPMCPHSPAPKGPYTYPKSRRIISTSTAMIKAPIADLPSWNVPLRLFRRLFLRRIAKSPLSTHRQGPDLELLSTNAARELRVISDIDDYN